MIRLGMCFIMGSFFSEPGDSMRAKRSCEYELFALVFLFSWVSAAGVLSPKGVNYEGKLRIFYGLNSRLFSAKRRSVMWFSWSLIFQFKL